jgi:hypothetical protein
MTPKVAGLCDCTSTWLKKGKCAGQYGRYCAVLVFACDSAWTRPKKRPPRPKSVVVVDPSLAAVGRLPANNRKGQFRPHCTRGGPPPSLPFHSSKAGKKNQPPQGIGDRGRRRRPANPLLSLFSVGQSSKAATGRGGEDRLLILARKRRARLLLFVLFERSGEFFKARCRRSSRRS